MRKSLRRILDLVLSLFGIQTIRKYELAYLQEKYADAVSDLTNLFYTSVLPLKLPENIQRNSLLCQLYGTGFIEALYIIYYLHRSLRFSGAVCELGIANGATSTLLANEIKSTTKHLWLFDSFQGLSKPGREDKLINDIFHLDSMDKYHGSMSYADSEVLERFKNVNLPMDRIHIVPGYIENTVLGKNLPKKVCFAYLDFDLYQPIFTGLKFLHKTLEKGGYIVVDDYGFFSTGVKRAVDRFIASHRTRYELISPPNYAGKFIIIHRV